MPIQKRRERERAERERLIVEAARELAETEGWDAVTTRRLAAEIEYSQPVLYSHFKGKDAIMAAVAVRGCADMAAELRAARAEAKGVRDCLTAVARTYTDFGRRRPALYDAMFTHLVDLPAPLREAFAELLHAVERDQPLHGHRQLTPTGAAGGHPGGYAHHSANLNEHPHPQPPTAGTAHGKRSPFDGHERVGGVGELLGCRQRRAGPLPPPGPSRS
jgi:AcrR family transcriptional regulator